MSLSPTDQIQIVTTIITSVGIIVALYSNRNQTIANRNQIETFNKQLKLTFFADYTRRYQEIILHLPESTNDAEFSFEKLENKEKDSALRYMRAYFDLCSEEFHLNEKSFIDKDVWELWENGIKHTLSKKAFRDAWKIIISNTKYNPNFEKWVEGFMKS